MINRINKIENLGIYRSFKPSKDVSDFKRYNLFYGWNGSGKSTLSRLFSSIEKKSMNSNHITAYFEASINEGVKINKATLRDHNLVLRVFNQDFIRDNIDWDKAAKSILLISEEKIEEKERLIELKDKLKKETDKLQKLNDTYNADDNANNKFLSDSARSIKKSFELVNTGDSYYMNYDKTKLAKIINEHKDTVTKPESILSEIEANTISNATKPVSKPIIDTPNYSVHTANLEQAVRKIDTLLTTSIVSTTIERLKENENVQKWVADGLELYKEHKNEKCDFCGQTLTIERIEALENHFNKEYAELHEKLNKALLWVDSLMPEITVLPNVISVYDEFQEEYSTHYENVKKCLVQINKDLEYLKSVLSQKLSNPFIQVSWEKERLDSIYVEYSKEIEHINSLIDKHNRKTKNFDNDVKENKKKLELHFVSFHVQNQKYFEKLKKAEQRKIEIDRQKGVIEKTKYDVQEIEKLLSNEVLGADQFNKQLQFFLGRDDIKLQFDTVDKGYRIIRKGDTKHTSSLSEGEKTAVAFVYFMVKLRENSNQIENTIVVIDDPISSFDSNHLFKAFTFLTANCLNVKQLFVFTHNYWFFKIVRDWLKKDGRRANTCFYTIENVIINSERTSNILNASKTLIDYHSEYHFLFSTLIKYKEQDTIDYEVSYSLGNKCRRLLESFIAFKYPKETKFRDALFNTGYDKEKLERIYWYVQKYSHSDRIEANDANTDNMLSEGNNVIIDVLEMLKVLDTEHYMQLEEICA